jgi:hypothetical protein
MPKFIVDLDRFVREWTTVVVEANTEEEAKRNALSSVTAPDSMALWFRGDVTPTENCDLHGVEVYQTAIETPPGRVGIWDGKERTKGVN